MTNTNNPMTDPIAPQGGTAMDFLMTYGWAILVLLIAVGVLFAFGAFDVDQYTQEQGDENVCLDACNTYAGWVPDLDKTILMNNEISCICVVGGIQ